MTNVPVSSKAAPLETILEPGDSAPAETSEPTPLREFARQSQDFVAAAESNGTVPAEAIAPSGRVRAQSCPVR